MKKKRKKEILSKEMENVKKKKTGNLGKEIC